METPKKEGEVLSPLSPDQPKFDYNLHHDETTVKAITDIYKIFGRNADKLSFNSKSEGKEIGDNFDAVAMEIVQAIISNNVPEVEMQNLIESFQTVIHHIFSIIAKMKTEYEKEYLARSMGSRDPGTGHYAREYATMGDLYKSLEKIRIEQKDDEKGYFNVKKAQ